MSNQKEDNRSKLIKYLAVIVSVVILLVLIIVKRNNPEFKTWIIYIVAGVLGLISLIIWFGMDFLKKLSEYKQKEKIDIPKPKNVEELKNKLKRVIEDDDTYMNHIKGYGKVLSKKVENEIIYYFYLELEYEDENLGKKVHALINANYPERYAILEEKNSSYEINKAIKEMGITKDPDVETRKDYDPLTGRIVEYQKKTHSKNQKDKDKKEADVQ